jgi:hypothetical protein
MSELTGWHEGITVHLHVHNKFEVISDKAKPDVCLRVVVVLDLLEHFCVLELLFALLLCCRKMSAMLMAPSDYMYLSHALLGASLVAASPNLTHPHR